MSRFRCTVAYCGAAYDGWQSQRNGRSVQEQIEAVLHDIAHAKINIVASGRTDAGVNARGQVFHFDSDMNLSARKWMGALNSRLPKDIHIMAAEEVSSLFHARYCVRKKQYDYRINLGPYDVFTKDTAYQCPVKLDVEKMKEASRYLVGTHDFTSFNSTPLSETPDQIRTVYDISFSAEGDILKISFIGKGFLRYMVRMMSAQMIEVGRGRLQPEDIQKMLEARSKTIARKNAPANGLTLEKVEYFEVIAMNEEIMIRERIEGDVLPSPYTDSPYILCERHSQKVLGVFKRSETEWNLAVSEPEDQLRAQDLKDQTECWIKARKEEDIPFTICGI